MGLATLAAYLDADDEIEIQDEHVELLNLDDEPNLIVIQVYITSAFRAYHLADHHRQQGGHVALGRLHVTSLPDEAAVFRGDFDWVWRTITIAGRGKRGSTVSSSATTWSVENNHLIPYQENSRSVFLLIHIYRLIPYQT